jgi:hypothetical protein
MGAINLKHGYIRIMGAINLKHTGSGSSITLSSDGTSLLFYWCK